jgi:hypothetical protein
MTDTTAGASIHYTTNGSTPTAASPVYSGPITVTTTETIHAIAIAAGHLDSNISVATYTKATQAVMPTFSPAPGTYSSAQQVTISSTTPGATIYYTTNGATPATTSTKYTAPVPIISTTTLKAIATAPNLTNSSVASGVYTIQTGATTVATPTFSPTPGTYTGYQYVSMSTTTPAATIYYTTNGTTPTTSSPKYVGAIIVHVSSTLKAIATAPNMTNSAVATGVYTIH